MCKNYKYAKFKLAPYFYIIHTFISCHNENWPKIEKFQKGSAHWRWVLTTYLVMFSPVRIVMQKMGSICHRIQSEKTREKVEYCNIASLFCFSFRELHKEMYLFLFFVHVSPLGLLGEKGFKKELCFLLIITFFAILKLKVHTLFSKIRPNFCRNISMSIYEIQ